MAISYHSRSIEAFESTSSSRLILDTAKKRGLPVLKLKIDSIQDDIDWIQVDEEGTDEDGMASPRRNNPNNFNRGRSYFFTGSGTMLLEGFSPGIGEKGLRMGANDQEYKNKIPMHGATFYIIHCAVIIRFTPYNLRREVSDSGQAGLGVHVYCVQGSGYPADAAGCSQEDKRRGQSEAKVTEAHSDGLITDN
jgi:hypothetical protein